MSAPPADAAELLWERVVDVASAAGQAELSRAADCIAVVLAEMVRAARRRPWLRAAAGLAVDPGPATVTGLDHRAAIPSGITANAFLAHASLADDSYRVASHPGQAVVSAVLALAEPLDLGGEATLRAVVGGYECACALADVLLPAIAANGWRVTSVIAPPAVAAVACLVAQASTAGPDALRLAAAQAGGPLAAVGEGDSWRLQPAIAAGQGVYAARAAMDGMVGRVGILEGPLGVVATMGGDLDALGYSANARILGVTFKRYPVAMYGQAIFGALDVTPPLMGELTAVRARVSPFAAAYGHQGPAEAAVSDVAGIVRAALRRFHPEATPPSAGVQVVADQQVGPLEARLEVETADGAVVTLRGDGDTSSWGPGQVARQLTGRIGRDGQSLFDAAHRLHTGTVAPLVEFWRGLR